jgi:hypothetical protein
MAALAPRLLRSPGKGGKPGSRRAILYLTSGCVKSSVLPPSTAGPGSEGKKREQGEKKCPSVPNRPANRSLDQAVGIARSPLFGALCSEP